MAMRTQPLLGARDRRVGMGQSREEVAICVWSNLLPKIRRCLGSAAAKEIISAGKIGPRPLCVGLEQFWSVLLECWLTRNVSRNRCRTRLPYCTANGTDD